MPEALALAALSTRLTETLAAVEVQRSTLEEVIVRLAEQAKHLTAVSSVLTGATHAQGAVLQELHLLLQGSGVAAANAEAALQPAAAAVAQAAHMLGPASTAAASCAPSDANNASFNATFDATFDDAATPGTAPAAIPAARSAVPPPGPPPAASPAVPPAAPSPSASRDRASSADVQRSSSSLAAYTRTSSFARTSRAVPVVEPDMDDEDGVQYVSNLHIQGAPVVGSTLTAEAEFVGQPSIQWYRSKGSAPAAEIPGASTLSYTLNADDLGCTVRVECVGPFGGDPVSAALKEVGPDPTAVAELQKLRTKKGGEKEIHVRSVPGDEPRILQLTREKLKLRKKGRTEWKHDYSRGLGVHLSTYDERGFTVQLDAAGASSVELAAESGAARDTIVFLLRSLVPGGGFTSAAPGTSVEAPSQQAEDNASEGTSASGNDAGGYMDHLKRSGKGRGDGDGDGEEAEEGEGEEEEFKPAVTFAIRGVEEVSRPSAEQLRTSCVGFAAPPPPSGASRRRGVSMSAASVVARIAVGVSSNTAANVPAPAGPAPVRPASVAVPTSEPSAMAPATGPLAQMRKARQLHEARAAEAAADRAAEKPPQTERAQAGGSSLDQMVGDDDDEPLNAPAATPPPPTATTPQTTATPSPSTSAGGADGVFNLLSIESIGATFDGAVLRTGSFQALGELRLLQLAQHGSAHAFKIALEKAGSVKGVQPNPRLARAVEGGNGLAFDVRVPARPPAEASKPLALLQYSSKADYAPIPLKVMPLWAHADGVDRLELRVAVHPALKGGLSDVRIVVTMGDEVTACRCEPKGDWQEGTRTLTWKVAHVPASAAPMCARDHSSLSKNPPPRSVRQHRLIPAPRSYPQAVEGGLRDRWCV